VRRQNGGPRSEFTDCAPDKRIEDVCIEGLSYGDKWITDTTGTAVRKNEYAADIRCK
jgi:hypothetical protein